jgi:hypothetical protein
MSSQQRELFTSSVDLNRHWGVSGRNIINKTQRWLDTQHIAMWQFLTSTQRQARKFILGPSQTAKTRKLSFNRMQSKVVTGLLVGHSTLRRHLYIMGLIDSPLCRTFGEHRRKPQSMFCESVKQRLHTHTPIWVPLLGPRGSEKSNSGAVWDFSKGTELP